MLVSRADLEASLARIRAGVTDPRHGVYGPHSPAWRLQRESLIFLGGGRAALLQLAHPFVAYGVEHHSQTRADVVGRFQRTFAAVFAMTFGDLDHAFVAARRVHAIHTRITGVIPEPVGPFAAGTPYHANDVDALLWVYATLIDTVVQVTERVRGPLAAADKDAYYVATWSFARLFGIPDAALPPDWPAFTRYMASMFASPILTVAPPARAMAAFLVGRGPGQRQNPLAATVEAVTSALLPDHLRAAFDLRHGLRERATARAVLLAARPAQRLAPAALRFLPAYTDASRRIDGAGPSPWAAWVERQLFALAGKVAGPRA
jgi:uncharacterized protein (DUF2236 family)